MDKVIKTIDCNKKWNHLIAKVIVPLLFVEMHCPFIFKVARPVVTPGPTPSDLPVAVKRVWGNLIIQNRKSEEGEVTNYRPSHTLQRVIKSEGANNNKTNKALSYSLWVTEILQDAEWKQLCGYTACKVGSHSAFRSSPEEILLIIKYFCLFYHVELCGVPPQSWWWLFFELGWQYKTRWKLSPLNHMDVYATFPLYTGRNDPMVGLCPTFDTVTPSPDFPRVCGITTPWL